MSKQKCLFWNQFGNFSKYTYNPYNIGRDFEEYKDLEEYQDFLKIFRFFCSEINEYQPLASTYLAKSKHFENLFLTI
jgi:hypothetical protein